MMNPLPSLPSLPSLPHLPPPKAVVLLSGGLDSTTALYLAVATHGIQHVIAISAAYGSKHMEQELRAAFKIASLLGIPHSYVALPENIFKGVGSTLIDSDKPNPTLSYKDIDKVGGISPTYVPFRNGNLLSIATASCLCVGASREKPIELWYGAHAEDAANWAYPDCTPEFNGAMMNAIFIGSYQAVRLVTPFQWMSKSDVVQEGSDLGVPFELTYSCYNGKEIHCGECPTCLGRQVAFMDAGVMDPTIYISIDAALNTKCFDENSWRFRKYENG